MAEKITTGAKAVDDLISAMRTQGVVFEKGLSEDELAAAEKALSAPFPEDYRLFLSVALPVSYNGNTNAFPQWRADPLAEVANAKEQMASMLSFDITHSDFWHPLLGDRPAELDAAIEQAQNTVSTWPPLARIYAHRYLPTAPAAAGNPIISVWQATDSVYYGVNVQDYLCREFELASDDIAYNEITAVPYWSEFFGLT